MDAIQRGTLTWLQFDIFYFTIYSSSSSSTKKKELFPELRQSYSILMTNRNF